MIEEVGGALGELWPLVVDTPFDGRGARRGERRVGERVDRRADGRRFLAHNDRRRTQCLDQIFPLARQCRQSKPERVGGRAGGQHFAIGVKGQREHVAHCQSLRVQRRPH